MQRAEYLVVAWLETQLGLGAVRRREWLCRLGLPGLPRRRRRRQAGATGGGREERRESLVCQADKVPEGGQAAQLRAKTSSTLVRTQGRGAYGSQRHSTTLACSKKTRLARL